MPRVIPKRPTFKPDDVIVAWESFATAHSHEVVKRDQELRGSHELVRRHPQFFVLAGTPPSEWPDCWEHALDFERVPDERVRVPDPIPDDEAAVASESFSADGGFVRKGQRLRRDDRLVLDHPHLFHEPPRPIG